MRKKAVFSPPHWALDSRNVALLVLGAALLPGQLTRISPQGLMLLNSLFTWGFASCQILPATKQKNQSFIKS